MSAQEEARDALYQRITKEAGDAGVNVEQTAKLAEAYAKVTFGAQGVTDYRYLADYHHTEHGGEPRPRPDAGFTS